MGTINQPWEVSMRLEVECGHASMLTSIPFRKREACKSFAVNGQEVSIIPANTGNLRKSLAFSGICYHSAATTNFFQKIPAISGNFWKFLSMLTIIAATSGSLWKPLANADNIVPLFTGDCHLPVLSLVPVAAGDCWHLPDNAGTCICRSMPEFAGVQLILEGLIICAGICPTLRAFLSYHICKCLLENGGICWRLPALTEDYRYLLEYAVVWESRVECITSFIICAGSCLRLLALINR